MLKKGQITIFIIITIIIVGGIVLFFVLKDNGGVDEVHPSIKPFYDSFQSCFEDISEEGVYYVAAHGGYYDVPFNTSIAYFTEDIPYYYLENSILIPNIGDVEVELGNYISENIKDCLNLDVFDYQGFLIDIGEASFSVDIIENKVSIKMISSISVSKGERSYLFKNVEVEINKNYYNLHLAAEEVVNSYIEKPSYICLTCLENIADIYSVEIESLIVEDVSIFKNNIIWFFISNKGDDLELDTKLKLKFIVEQ